VGVNALRVQQVFLTPHSPRSRAGMTTRRGPDDASADLKLQLTLRLVRVKAKALPAAGSYTRLQKPVEEYLRVNRI